MFPEGRALEFLIAAIVALIVVGPKDLPILLRKFGQFMAKVRSMAAEFRASFDEMARQSELDELRKEVEAMRQGQLADIATHAGAPEVNQAFEEISRGLSDVGVQLNSPTSYPYAAETAIEVKPAPKPRRKAAETKKPAVKKAASKTAPAKAAAKSKAAALKPATEAPARKSAKATGKATSAKPRPRKATVS